MSCLFHSPPRGSTFLIYTTTDHVSPSAPISSCLPLVCLPTRCPSLDSRVVQTNARFEARFFYILLSRMDCSSVDDVYDSEDDLPPKLKRAGRGR